MALHFSEQELAERRKRTCASMAADGLDGLLIFRQETMFYPVSYTHLTLPTTPYV